MYQKMLLRPLGELIALPKTLWLGLGPLRTREGMEREGEGRKATEAREGGRKVAGIVLLRWRGVDAATENFMTHLSVLLAASILFCTLFYLH